MEDKTMRSLKYTAILTLSILLAIGALACGGGSKDPVNNDPHNQNSGGASLVGRILDMEGNPVGQPLAKVDLKTAGGSGLAPVKQPQATGPDAGRFEYIGLPIGIPMVLEIELFQISIGRNLGWKQDITLTSGGKFDLGDIVLQNDFLELGWNSYTSKDYVGAIEYFNRAFNDREAQAGLTYSSSAYTGLGWVYAKRGKDNQTGLKYADDDGNWVDTINSYEWDQAILEFKRAITNPEDADAWVGMGGAYLTLIGQANKDPIILGPWIPFYGFLDFYFNESQAALDSALKADPNYNCSHDTISANDIKATLLFVKFMQGQSIDPSEVTSLAQSPDLNQGSMQLLEVLPDLILYNPYPQL
jgi:hypothetical protein